MHLELSIPLRIPAFIYQHLIKLVVCGWLVNTYFCRLSGADSPNGSCNKKPAACITSALILKWSWCSLKSHAGQAKIGLRP